MRFGPGGIRPARSRTNCRCSIAGSGSWEEEERDDAAGADALGESRILRLRGPTPAPRSGHTAVGIGKSKVVVFGGFADKRFLGDIAVYDVENRLWYTPECTGSGPDVQAGPSARAFHVAVIIDCNLFVFGGRSGGKRLGDFWMLDTDIWQWLEMTGFGDLPSPREFAAASAIGNRKSVMYGGWDGKKWLSDVYVMDTMSLEWTELAVVGSAPPPRCGHSATMIEKRLLVFGGRGNYHSLSWCFCCSAKAWVFEDDSSRKVHHRGGAWRGGRGGDKEAGGEQVVVDEYGGVCYSLEVLSARNISQRPSPPRHLYNCCSTDPLQRLFLSCNFC